MKFGSVCSGIEAASVAWEPLGWKAAFLSDIEAFPRAALKYHFPDVSLHGDFTTIFVRLAQRLRPRWLVWENVPGVLSIDGGRAFGSFLGGLAECGYGFAYRILDAQYFGVPQRRRRVFVVGYLGDWRPPAAVLFDRESLSGNSPPSRKTGQGTSRLIAPCPFIGGEPSTFRMTAFGEYDDDGTASTLKARDFKDATDLVAFTARGGDGGRHEGVMTPNMVVRRLTPRECERLQGFPDDWTLVPFGKGGGMADDTHRYKALGNSMAVPVMRKIGKRINWVNDRLHRLWRAGMRPPHPRRAGHGTKVQRLRSNPSLPLSSSRGAGHPSSRHETVAKNLRR